VSGRAAGTCYSCRWWLGEGVRERGPHGQCRRLPPTVVDRWPDGRFPRTLSTAWCGEWTAHPHGRDPALDEPD